MRRSETPEEVTEVLLDATDVARILRVPRRTVYKLVDEGLLPYKRVGLRMLRFSPSDLDELYKRSAERKGEV